MNRQTNLALIYRRHRQAGFTLLEVLIALLVLSLALLGLAALQTFGMRMTLDSYGRTQATVLAYDVIDRLRANPTAALATGSPYLSGPIIATTAAPGYGGCPGACANATEMANYDIAQWISMMNNGGDFAGGTPTALFGGNDPTIPTPTQIQIQSGGGGVFTVTIRWQDRDLPLSQSVTARIF